MDKIKTTIALLLPVLLLAGCKKEEDKGISLKIKNLSFLYQFEAIPGKVKSTHQTVFDANGEKRYDGVFNFDKEGCVTDFDVTNLDVGNISVRRDKDRLVGEENGNPVLLQLDSKCNVLSKTSGNFTIDIIYNDRGLISGLSSAQSDYRVELTYDDSDRLVGQHAFSGERQISEGVQKYAADAGDKPSDAVTISKTPEGTRETTTRCDYQQGVPVACRFTIKTTPGDKIIERHAQLTTEFY
ncbi:YnfC family lipoprotein [Erwinia sorbitola]|uniref:YnfC family lipoprotein n=1 Tax=Erwinia sorbitola TaxID=2681984 RepID=A0A6I6ELX1_9GAMM|nr:YnfC family lipoprotein [Erwinia sorbitola]QGU87651.1 YnfC family lipoprotein [Erwinia sorbitola]